MIRDTLGSDRHCRPHERTGHTEPISEEPDTPRYATLLLDAPISGPPKVGAASKVSGLSIY